MHLHAFLNGKIVPLENARISVLDLGVLRGFGVYEGITAFLGEPFRFEDHWKRLEKSAKALDLTIPYSAAEILEAMRKVIALNAPDSRASIRLVLTGGIAEGGIEHISGRETLYFTVEVATPLSEELYKSGAKLITREHERFMPEYKTIHYISAVIFQNERKAAGALEVLYVSKGTVLECATSNIGIVKAGTIIMPKDGILHGVTRTVTLELARAANYPVEERAVSSEELLAADEAFITSSFKDIVPIVRIDDATIANGKPGPITQDLMARFAAYAIKKEPRP